MSSVTDIYNRALTLCGSSNIIADAAEQSREANLCRLWYPTVRRAVLGSAPWTCARKQKALALLAGREAEVWSEGAPVPGFRFAYAAPQDMLRPWYLSSGARFDLSLRPDNTQAINTDQERPVLRYITDQEVVSRWEDNLQMAVVYALAAYIAMPLVGKLSIASFARREATRLSLEAQQVDGYSDYQPVDFVPEHIAVRGYSEISAAQQYVHPFGTIFGDSLQPVSTKSITTFPGATGR